MRKGQILCGCVFWVNRIKLPTIRTNLYIFYWLECMGFHFVQLLLSQSSEWEALTQYCRSLSLSHLLFPNMCTRSLDGHYIEYYHHIIRLNQIQTLLCDWVSLLTSILHFRLFISIVRFSSDGSFILFGTSNKQLDYIIVYYRIHQAIALSEC